ncbi:MAG TPA: hypothetical protein VFH68_21375 [Polyangia bacterium]|nr:hypothetical protein [Polyangia bacterium]
MSDSRDGSRGPAGAGGPAGAPPDLGAELIQLPGSKREADAENLDHLAANRRLIIRRSLLATAVGGVVPLPVMDDYLAGRVRAGMLMKLAERRQVDLVLSSAELLADPREATAVRNATMTAATLLALKLAWKKFFAVLAVGRRAEDMATTFQMGTLFDHFCTKLHVGAGIDRARASELRGIIHASVSDAEKTALTAVFRDGGRILGRSLLEAPAWMSNRFERAAEHWARTGGQPGTAAASDADTPIDNENARWLDRAAGTVESRLNQLGTSYLRTLVRSFEQRWRQAEAARDAETPPESAPP